MPVGNLDHLPIELLSSYFGAGEIYITPLHLSVDKRQLRAHSLVQLPAMRYASRKFIDLIQGATSKWANWDPPTPITVGSYGTIDPETGEFLAEGNIYNEEVNFDFDRSDKTLQPLEHEHADDQFIANSWGVSSRTFDPGLTADAGPTNAAFKIELDFENSKRAAVLIMHKSKYKTLPNDERIARILSTRPDNLKGKAIVTQTVSCAAYLMYLSGTKKEKMAVTLNTNVPTTDAGGAVGFTWSSEGYSGLLRSGGDPKATYVPLYRIQRPPFKFWDRILGRRGEMEDNYRIEQWLDVYPRWQPLDPDGEEDEIYDAEMEGDFGVFTGGNYPHNHDDSDDD